MLEPRVLTEDDRALWRELRLAALAEAPYAFSSKLAEWQGAGDREERWRARLGIPGSYNIVAVLEGQPVGMVSGVPAEEGGAVELISMWVAPVARGSGVGDELVRAVERWARHAGAEVLRLSLAEGNGAASALYQRNGFRYTGELGDLLLDGVRRERVMVKALSASAHRGAGGTRRCPPGAGPPRQARGQRRAGRGRAPPVDVAWSARRPPGGHRSAQPHLRHGEAAESGDHPAERRGRRRAHGGEDRT